MNTPVAIPQAVLSRIAGPQLLGIFFNWGLTSALTVQVYLYHIMFPEDPWSLRALVYGVFAFEWVQTGLTTSFAFDKFVYNFGNTENLPLTGSSWFFVPVMCGVVSLVVQIFYARRIWVLSKSMILGGIVCVLAFMQAAAAIAVGILLRGAVQTNVPASVPKSVVLVWLIGSVLVDIYIATAMTILLLKTKTGIRKTDSMVNKLVRLVIESGTATATISLVGMSLFIAYPRDNFYSCPLGTLAKLYANTMVTSLNNRAFLQRMMLETRTALLSMPSGEETVLTESGRRPFHNSAGLNETMIRVDVLSETHNDTADYPMKDYRMNGVMGSHV